MARSAELAPVAMLSSILFVRAWSIRDDELAFGGTEITIGHINGNALFAFFLEPVCRQRRVKLSANGTLSFWKRLRSLPIRLRKASWNRTAGASDQVLFTIVNTAARDEAQQLLLLVLFQIRFDIV